MNKLYNKIYKAVNEGIQKALLIDPEQNDVSINYSYHKIDNAVMDENKFNKIAENFIKKSTIEKYNNVLAYSINGVYQYKVKNFDELSNIFNKIQNITDDIDLSWIDMTNAVTFIMSDSSELLNEINNKDNIVFIKFNHISDFDHPIIIHKNLLIADKELIWSIVNENVIQVTDNRSNGYENTEIIENSYNLNKYPAFEYCVNLKKDLNLKLLNYEGYLPAIKELKFLSENVDLINYILTYANGQILYVNTGNWWSSTQHSDVNAWYLSYKTPASHTKNSFRQILPLFHKKEIKNKL